MPSGIKSSYKIVLTLFCVSIQCLILKIMSYFIWYCHGLIWSLLHKHTQRTYNFSVLHTTEECGLFTWNLLSRSKKNKRFLTCHCTRFCHIPYNFSVLHTTDEWRLF